ncbi:conjugal transfer protein TraF [bacterium]|nr:conjugal transfer protein TraF [bacterium]MBU1995000.1 conjugal transfer protein TraF [bacterium]
MKKIISLALLGATTSLMAMYAEHAYLYKDPRIMGMGGANVAVGSYSTSVFSNPAGLANIKKEHGFVVDLLGLGVSLSSKVQEFLDDVDKASNSGNDADMANVLSKYSGEHFHLGVDNYTSISKNSDAFAWSIGLLAAVDVNFMAHGNGSEMGELLQTTSRGYGGVILGVAKPYDTEIGRLDIGVGLKYITQKSYEGSLGITELTGDGDIGQKLQDRYEKTSSGIGLDLGATYHPFAQSAWHPAVGLSVLNIGSMEMDKNFGGQPMTVNVGISVTPEVSFLNKLVLAVDYVDMLNANKLRIYNYNSTGDTVSYTDYEESDFMKRLRIGAGLGLIDTSYFSTTVNVGMYQSAYTAGVNLELALVKLNFATYEEQIGTGSVDIPDRRYMAQIGIGW